MAWKSATLTGRNDALAKLYTPSWHDQETWNRTTGLLPSQGQTFYCSASSAINGANP
jgi:hypothetical protein